MSDIVERLRECDVTSCLCQEAADEIERLRDEVNGYHTRYKEAKEKYDRIFDVRGV